jgi:hypothetical protein
MDISQVPVLLMACSWAFTIVRVGMISWPGATNGHLASVAFYALAVLESGLEPSQIAVWLIRDHVAENFRVPGEWVD